MKEQFRDSLHLNKKNMAKLVIVNDIIKEYADQGYRLTLRQLYYQLVSRAIVPNKTSEYAKLSTLLVKGRMAGYIDWRAIEDRLRIPYLPYWVEDVPDAINDTIRSYRLDRQKGQSVYIELWVEKDALSGVLRPLTTLYHVNLMVNRGYTSCSALYDAYRRIENAPQEKAVILYLGDHDPSGLDMIRDIGERLGEFGAYPEIKHIGLTTAQVKKYNPPPNPAKITDPRAGNYIYKHGKTSWEVDALTPQMLNKLVKTNIEKLIDMDLFRSQLQQEQVDKDYLENISSKLQ